MERLYAQIDHASREGIVLCFALAKIYDDLNEVDRSFALLKEGNRHHKVGKIDTVDDARDIVGQLHSVFESGAAERLTTAQSQRPLFVLGMPRSGTSLVEQILCSHPQVNGGGELKMLGQWCVGYLKLKREKPETPFSALYLNDLRRHYFRGVAPLLTKPFFTDKMPQNFMWLGFILAAFPEAKIIHTHRDPMAVCWSIYKTDFAGVSHGYSCDLADIGEFYKLYVELMNFWRQRFPDALFELDYERLTTAQEDETRRLLAYCGLDWHTGCLAFQDNPRQVNTASWAQVKRPMYCGSSASWRRYASHLEPLRLALASVLGVDRHDG